ncbi:unnamed protein product, partial [Heterosigma akashiwo]
MDTEDFLEEPNENFICIVCHNVMIDPRACNEGHQFCLVCITEWLGRSSTCPARCSLGGLELHELTKNRAVANLIDKLQIRCHQKREGCDWVGSVEDRRIHTMNECLFTEVECKWEGCGTKIQRLELAGHEASCEERQVSCENSQASMSAKEKEAHVLKCHMAEVECPEGCGARVQRGILQEHMEECPEEEVECSFAEHGCDLQGKRREVEEHEQDVEALRIHLQLVLQVAKVLERQVGDQKRLVGDQQRLITSLQAQQCREQKVLWRIEDFRLKALEKKRLLSKAVSVNTNTGAYNVQLQLDFVRRKNSSERGFIGLYIKHVP